jgi:hypothetical protein
MSHTLRKYRDGDCIRWLEYTKNVTCTNPVVYDRYCEEHIPYDLRRRREYGQTSVEIRQRFLDEFKSGKTVGEAREAAGISLDVAMEILNRSIETASFFNYKAKDD